MDAKLVVAAWFAVAGRRVVAPADFSPPAKPPAAVVVAAAVVVESGSVWERAGELEKVLGKASAILARCGVSLGEIEVVSARWSPDALKTLNDQNPYTGPAEMRVMDDPSLPAGRPLIMLFGQGSIPSTAKAYNRSSIETLARGKPEVRRLFATTWITRDRHDKTGGDIAPSYSVLAHELVHLLGDQAHVLDAPNLMTDSETAGAKSGDLDEAQCAAVRTLDGAR